MVSLPMVPQDDCMEQIIVELRNVNSKSDKLTDYILNNYVEDASFVFHIWNHFDSIGEGPRTNNHLEGYHRQLNARIQPRYVRSNRFHYPVPCHSRILGP